jgi:hypothetical protein
VLRTIAPKKLFLFSSTRSNEAPSKTEREKDFDSTVKFLSIAEIPELIRPTHRKKA